MLRVATGISDEARAMNNTWLARGKRNLYQGLVFWSPNINIVRDPRWGRGQETYGEDPFLTGAIGTAFVKGMQGTDPRYLKTVATAKHYAVHSGPESLRHSFDARVSESDLRETYLPAFRDLVVDGKAESVMCSYNFFRGQPRRQRRAARQGPAEGVGLLRVRRLRRRGGHRRPREPQGREDRGRGRGDGAPRRDGSRVRRRLLGAGRARSFQALGDAVGQGSRRRATSTTRSAASSARK